jgi:hypothetical protein
VFDPKAHLIQLPRRVKDQQTGQWVTRQDEYLEVKWRMVMFRERYPHGSITTEPWLIDWAQGVAVCQATVDDGEGGKASAFGTETRKSFEDFVAKAGTRAVGRALALLGFGTQFVGEELSEGEHVTDAPVATGPQVNLTTSNSDPLPAREGPSQGSTEVHPTADEITTLVDSARSANVSNDDFAHDMRRLMRLPDGQKITKKFLRETMTMAQYNTARAHYGEKLRQILEHDVPDYTPPEASDGPAPPNGQPDASTAASEAATEGTAAPEAAPPADPAEADREKLRREVAAWPLRVSEHEVEHIISHHPYAKARALLWKARLQPSSEALVAD